LYDIAQGSFGQVSAVSYSGVEYAAKMINIKKSTDEGIGIHKILSEASIMQSIHHINVAQ